MAEYVPKQENYQSPEDQEDVLLEQDEGFHRTAGETIIRALENSPSREKIYHPERKQSETRIAGIQHEADAKARDIEIDARRQFRREAKGDYNYTNLSVDKLAKRTKEFSNFPLIEDNEEPVEGERRIESVEARAEKLFNFYKSNFDRNAPSWASYGVSSLLEKGIINPDNEALLRSGFWAHEEDRVHERIDPNDDFSNECIDAEMNLRSKVTKELIPEKSTDLDPEAIKKSKQDGMLYAISSGARRDKRTGKVIFSIPTEFETGNKVVKFMRENDVNPDEQSVQLLSYSGFAGIIDVIKGDKRVKEKGFKALDWYFDTFGYQKHMEEFTDTLESYHDEDDKAFSDTLQEFFSHRKEMEEWKKQQEGLDEATISALAEAKTVSREEFLKMIAEAMPSTEGIEMFPFEDSNNRLDLPGRINSKIFPSSGEKCTKAKEQVRHILNLDPNATFAIGTVFERENRGHGPRKPKQDYAIIRFGYNDHNNVICIHIGKDSRAMFCWRGQTGDDAEGWREYFKNTSIRTRNTAVKRFVCSGYAKHGTKAIDAEWSRIWKYLDSKESA